MNTRGLKRCIVCGAMLLVTFEPVVGLFGHHEEHNRRIEVMSYVPADSMNIAEPEHHEHIPEEDHTPLSYRSDARLALGTVSASPSPSMEIPEDLA